MRITVKQLKSLINESVKQAILLKEYEQILYKDHNGDCWIEDDEGNRDPYNGPECGQLQDGDSMPWERSSYGSSYGSGGYGYSRRRRRY